MSEPAPLLDDALIESHVIMNPLNKKTANIKTLRIGVLSVTNLTTLLCLTYLLIYIIQESVSLSNAEMCGSTVLAVAMVRKERMAGNNKSQNPAKRAEVQAEREERAQKLVPKKKVTPKWLVPVFVTLLIVGLLWVVVFYITNTYPIPGIHSWNILIGFVIMLTGFIMTMWWQ
jgi:uncharacterized membrane protein (DUF485 family)